MRKDFQPIPPRLRSSVGRILALGEDDGLEPESVKLKSSERSQVRTLAKPIFLALGRFILLMPSTSGQLRDGCSPAAVNMQDATCPYRYLVILPNYNRI